MRLSDSRLKIERANKHIADIRARIHALPDFYTATIEINPQTGNEVIKHDLSDRTVITDVALMIGDAVHNLKCALDYAWAQTINRLVPTAVSKFSKFPVRSSKDELESALKGREIDIAAPQLFKLVVFDIKAYAGGNDSIWCLHQLNILDKHRLLLPVVTFGAIEGIELENEHEEIVRGGTWGTTQQTPYYVPVQSGWQIKNKGHVSVAVVFEEGTPVQGMEVADMLSTFAINVLSVTQLLEIL
ncbi:MAG TPA: hypothetical protein VNW97_12550 [Candidatus Saccharimonadales bacterium]|jgi:hypothetical protein|nr:hypothetical protein [Candidatus Saccharimonadales bacterium]